MDARKLPFSAGAEWLLGGFGLLRRSPLGLGLLGAIFGALSAVAALAGSGSPALAAPLNLLVLLLGPILMGGMAWAAAQVDAGRKATPDQLLQGFRDGKALRLLALLLPQVALLVVAVVLLFVMVGTEQITALAAAVESAQGQTQPDPKLFEGIAMGRIALWTLLLLALGVIASFFTFTAFADVMVGNRGAMDAMRRSLRACLRNVGALLLFFVLVIVAAVGISIAVQILAMIVRLIAGDAAMQMVMSVLLMAVLLPVVTGAMYLAWKQMLGDAPTAPALPVEAGFEA